MFRKIIGFMVFYVLLSANLSFAADRIGVVGAANKNITALGDGGNSRSLNLGDDIFFNETISADSTGNAQLLFVDKSALTIGANSSVKIDQFVYNPSTSSGNLIMQGTKGTFRFIGGALSKKNPVKIKTPVGTIGIRGGIAIIDINPATGATNATFVYGQALTFQNLAGDMQSISDMGAGLSVPTANSIPEIFQATTAEMAMQVQSLAGREGTTAGASIVPTDAKIGITLKKMRINNIGVGDENDSSSGDDANGEGGNGKDGKDGDSKEGDESNSENGDESNSDEGGNKGGKDGKNADNKQGNNGQSGPNGRGPAGGPNDGGRGTASGGGYYDSKGNYVAGGPNGANGGTNGGGYYDSKGSYVAGGPNGPNGGPGPMDGGRMTADGGFMEANGTYHSPAEVKAYQMGGTGGDITLTADGGFLDSSGTYHDATALAAYRAGQTDTSSGGYYDPATGGTYYGGDPAAGGYYDPAMGGGGYYDPATGGTYYGGDQYAGGYYDPAMGGGGYYDPATGGYTAGGYYDPYAGGGYYDPAAGGYYDPAMGGGGYYDPYAGGGYYDPYAGGGYYDPYAGGYTTTGGYYDPYTGVYYDPNQYTTTTTTNYLHAGIFNRLAAGDGHFVDEGDLSADSNTSSGFKVLLYSFTNPGSNSYAVLPNVAAGYRSISGDFGLGLNASGWAYATQNLNMFIYRFENNKPLANNLGMYDQYNFVAGKTIQSQGVALPTTGRQYFSFLPDAGKYMASWQNDMGFFNWNIADQNLIAGTAITVPSGRKGILVDWGKKAFLGGNLDWSANKMRTAYGSVGYDGMFGRLLQYEGPGGYRYGGNVNVFGDEVYGTSTAIDGMIGSGWIGSQNSIETPWVSSSDIYTNTYQNGSGGNLPFGYMAGWIINSNGGTYNYNSYWTNGTFAYTRNAQGKLDGASVNMDKLSGSGPASAYGSFGYGGNQTAYIDDNVYAFQQDYGSSNGGQGVLVSSKLLTNLGCSACDYVHWGVWAAENPVTAGDYNNLNFVNLIPYIAGTVTDMANMPTNLSANYSGVSIGNIFNGTSLTNTAGTLNANLNISGGVATIGAGNLQIGLGGYNLSNSGIISLPGSGMATFNGAALTGTGITGSANGALFGPQGQNIGGNFNFNNGGSVQGTGVYLGTR